MTRRESLRLGALSGLGLTLPGLLAGQGKTHSGGRAKACILLFMYGGPAHQDTWDMKPDGPVETRGEFRPIPSNVPGIQVCEHLPQLSQRVDRMAIIRSLTHSDSVHETAFYTMATGRLREPGLVGGMQALPGDHPNIGSVVSHLSPNANHVFSPFVATRGTLENGGGNQHYPGLGPGFLGRASAPTVIESPNLHKPDFSFDGLGWTADLSQQRWDERRRLLDVFGSARGHLTDRPTVKEYGTFFDRAYSLVTSPKARSALDLSKESAEMRQRYGMTLYGQHLLLARRLVEAGVKLITVYWNLMVPRLPINGQPLWDTHVKNFMYLKDLLLPSVDGPISALLDDLEERGLLDETLVVWMGEFGRTPGINANGGRDHWGHAASAVLAGGGIRGGQVYGSTDAKAAFPTSNPVRPGDMSATIFHALGIPPHTMIHDQLNRPVPAADGSPLTNLFDG